MVLSIENLSKTYQKGKKKALNDFSVELTPGVYGLLGANGAGKSTLFNIITDNIKSDSGTVKYNGTSTLSLGKDFRNILGYMPQQQGLYDDFTANRFLWYMCSLKGINKKEARQRIDEVLNLVNLTSDAHKKLGAFSGGMKQRILIAQALLNNPEVLILDEPTAGLDPKERIRIRNFISEISLNKIVLIATHVVSDIEFIAKEVILIKDGKLIKKDLPVKITHDMQGRVFEKYIDKDKISQFQKTHNISNIVAEGEGAILRFINDGTSPPDGSVEVKPTLEDLYLDLFADEN